jgi:hypothetical protein
MPIKDDKGTTLSTHEEQVKQWRHHFETVLNCPEPAVLHDFTVETVPDQRSTSVLTSFQLTRFNLPSEN